MTPAFRRILVPHDFSEPATRALVLAADLARRHRGRLMVLHVITPFQPVTGLPDVGQWIPEAEILAGARKALADVVARTVKGPDAPPVDLQVVLGDPYRRIVDAARRADLIVMATAGRTGVSHLLIGSVAEKVVRHAPVPVLTVRPAPARGGRAR
jgi:nucleotide-binding universal stress UspA family protein